MNLNFWQWLGVVLIVIGVAYYVLDRRPTRPNPQPTTPTTQAP